jgi:hypothetical protein
MNKVIFEELIGWVFDCKVSSALEGRSVDNKIIGFKSK